MDPQFQLVGRFYLHYNVNATLYETVTLIYVLFPVFYSYVEAICSLFTPYVITM